MLVLETFPSGFYKGLVLRVDSRNTTRQTKNKAPMLVPTHCVRVCVCACVCVCVCSCSERVRFLVCVVCGV